MKLLSARIRIPPAGSIARQAGWVFVGQGITYLLQVLYFVILARMLGVREYGVFAGASALVSLATPFSSLGAGMLFMRYVNIDATQRRRHWGNIVLATIFSNLFLIAALCFTAPHLLNAASARVIIPVSIANCCCGQFIQCVVQVFQCFQMMRIAAFWSAALNGLRFAAVVFMMIRFHQATAIQWAWASAYVTILVAAAGAIAVTSRFGRPIFEPALLVRNLGEGALYSVSSSTASAYNDLDKTLLSHYGMNVANGIYTTAYRVIDLATIPVSSVEWATLPRFFREAKSGTRKAIQSAQRVLPRSIFIGLVASGSAFVCAPLIPRILGQSFAESALALRWLCLLPAFRAVHLIAGAALTGAGYQRYRTVAQASVVALNLVTNLFWIPRYGWLGAAWASLISDGALAIACWSLMLWVRHCAPVREDAPALLRGKEAR